MHAEQTASETGETNSGGILRWLGFSCLFVLCLLLFTVAKLPQPKIHAWVLGTLNQQTLPMGFEIAADEGKIQLGWGLVYEMSGVRLTKFENQKTLRFSRLEVSPSLIGPLLKGKLGGADFRLEEGAGVISGGVAVGSGSFSSNLQLEGVNLGRMGILPFATGLEGTADLRGTVDLAGPTNLPSALTGRANLKLNKLVIDAQKTMGFDIPRTAVGEATVDILIDGGTATFTSVRLGKAGGSDDLFADVTGSIKLEDTLPRSTANLRVKFGFSDRYRQEKTISLVESLIGMFKRTDGGFGLRLAGPLYAVQPSPDP